MKKVLRGLTVIAMMFLMLGTLAGCYVNAGVDSDEVGLQMGNGVTIESVVGSGRYTKGGWFSSLERVDVAAKTVIWEDPDMWTSDKQPVKFKVSITYARKRDAESVRKMWERFNSEAKDDKALETLVLTRVPRVAKQVTTSMTLDQMLGIADSTSTVVAGRTVLQDDMSKLLKIELDECGIDLLDVGVNDIGVDEEYAKKLKEKAVSKVATELSQQKTIQLNDQVAQEKAQTEIDLEIARRKKLVLEEENKIYQLNPQAYELERIRLLKDVIGKNDKIYFVPQGSDVNVILSGSGAPNTVISPDK